jgi:hypothetical protein
MARKFLFALPFLMIVPANAQDDKVANSYERIGKALQACRTRFLQRFGDTKTGQDYIECILPQERAANHTCLGAGTRGEFAACVTNSSIRVMETCDLTKC